MGNESFRSSRHSGTSTFKRSSSTRRHSKSTSSTGQNYIAEDEVDRQQQSQELTPKPQRRMDKIRRSLSFRRKKKSSSDTVNSNSMTSKKSNKQQQQSDQTVLNNTTTTQSSSQKKSTNDTPQNTTSNTTSTTNPATNANDSATASSNGPTRPALWIEDEKKVRAGNCSFQVKYLGFQEVSDSRGMHICELAIERLIADKDKKKPIKAILYVSGDSLRVVDESNKTLLVDQTIEKVSFCAPDRHHENGFAYICRDGTARRWLCHGFLAIKDTLKGASTGSTGGERLSHAVGCAFSVCLERKQKRERENVTMEVGPNHSFTRLGSFRQASLTERFEDPQMVIPAVEPVPIKHVDNPHAIERPKPSQDSFTRQNSLRATGNLQLPFKRNTAAYTSLKPGELPSFQQQKLAFTNNSTSSTKTSLLQQKQSQNQAVSPTQMPNSDTLSKINTISELPEETDKLSEQFNQQLTTATNPQSQWPMYPQASVFNTPVTPSTTTIQQQQTPPPLPPMPVQYLTQTPLMYYQQQQQQQIQQQAQPILFTTPPTMTAPQTETFEQKWARLQAAKNTNPFAEDIAKKYEIKL